jgi:hypothetical protein
MSDEKSTPDGGLDDDSQSSKDTKKRSIYPAKDLKTIIEFIGRVYTQLGHTTFLSNKAIATVHGMAPESIKQHLSSGQQYKFLELKHGTGYKITDHFQKLYLPKNDSEKRLLVIESLKNPEAYRQLFKDYEYHVVPPDGVKNHFIRNFGFKEEAAAKAAQIFLDNLKDFGLLDSRGVLISALPAKATVSEAIEVPANESNHTLENQENNERQLPARQRPEKLIFQSEIDADGKKPVPIYLTDNKQAVFVYPDDITEDDIELVKHQIDGILLRIKFEAKKNANSQKNSE